MTYLFVDTNILLHYHRLEDIDWLALSKSNEVVIVLCPVVVRELEEHKIGHSSGKIRRRAQEIIASFHSIVSCEKTDVIRDGVRLEFISDDPKIDFISNGLRSEITDDWLIASTIEFKQKNPEVEIQIVTADLGLSIKSKARKIKTLRPLEKDKLPEELDADEKRIRDLKKELAEIKNSLPELTLCFWRCETPHVFQAQVQTPIPFSEGDADAELQRIRTERPYFSRPSPKKIGQGLSIRDMMRGGVSQEQADQYNSGLNSYYESYVDYLHQKHDFENAMRRSIALEIGLDNSGTVPADDIDVHLHFPDGFSLYDADENLPKAPESPVPPDEPGNIKIPSLGSLYVPSSDYTTALRPPGNISSPRIERTNSYDVRLNIKKAKHGYILRVAKFLVQFESYESVASFKIDYTISAANLPKAADGHLSVVTGPVAG